MLDKRVQSVLEIRQTGMRAVRVRRLQKGTGVSGGQQTLGRDAASCPRDIDELAASETCWFCAGDEKETADGYALIEMANPEPYFEKGIIFGYGKKVRSPVGSLLSVPIAVGPKCRRAIRMIDIIQIGWLVGMFVLSLALLMIPQIARPMVNLFPLMPVAFVALMVGAGWYIGRNLSLAFAVKNSGSVRFDPAGIPVIRQMLARDWYFFQTNHGMPRISFTKTLPRGSLFAPAREPDADERGESA